MLNASLLTLTACILLYLGAEGLLWGSGSLGVRLKLPSLIVGLTMISFATSLPELTVSAEAAFLGLGDIAIGNVIGSNICNIGLILGLSALIRPIRVRAQVIRSDTPIAIVGALLVSVLLLDGVLGRIDGVLLTLGIVGYVVLSVKRAPHEDEEVKKEFRAVIPRLTHSVWFEVGIATGSLGLLFLGGGLFVHGAVAMSLVLGVSHAVISLTLVALGTSLPELATAAVAAAKDKGDLAIGNVIGSTIFNLLAILGLSSLLRPIARTNIGMVDLGVMTGIVILLLPLMMKGLRIGRLEGGLLVVLYAGYIAWLLP
jgi:cation:H+ antiporter